MYSMYHLILDDTLEDQEVERKQSCERRQANSHAGDDQQLEDKHVPQHLQQEPTKQVDKLHSGLVGIVPAPHLAIGRGSNGLHTIESSHSSIAGLVTDELCSVEANYRSITSLATDELCS